MTGSIISPEDQKVTFVELFFDLVFVFSVTQVVGLFHGHLDLVTLGTAILVFWLIWWGWTQFTWSLNSADTTQPFVELGVLVATGVAFFMAGAVPAVYGERSLWFAVSYVIVRAIGLALQYFVAMEIPEMRAALRNWVSLSALGLLAVLAGGAIGGTAQYLLWGLAILLDLVAAGVGGQAEGWVIHPAHFAERHGLFVIIALGESLIVAASGVTEEMWTIPLLSIAGLVVAITGGLWWSYFPHAMHGLEHALASVQGAFRARLARDSYSLMHFAMIFGIVAFAVAVEEIIAHPDEPLAPEGRLALALGQLLFVGGMALAYWRATRIALVPRLLLVAFSTVAILFLEGVSPIVSLGIALASLLILLGIEQRTFPGVAKPPHGVSLDER
ncbi:MAG: low temperature requirement protein A [Anaerolineales bacterium]|nr:low temperature requirement protein A [Anaerolineales bacterium]